MRRISMGLYFVHCNKCGYVDSEHLPQQKAGARAWHLLSRVKHCPECKHAWHWQCCMERPVPHPTAKVDPVPQA